MLPTRWTEIVNENTKASRPLVIIATLTGVIALTCGAAAVWLVTVGI